MVRLAIGRMILNEREPVLRPHQHAPAQALIDILRATDCAVDLSDMGTGKTFVAAYVAKSLRLGTLVVCPDIAKSAWHRAAAAFGDKLSVINYEALRTGRSPYGYWDRPLSGCPVTYKCINCQCKLDLSATIPACYCHPQGIHCVETKKQAQDPGRFNFHQAIGLIIFDEVHKCNGLDSLNADMLIAAKRGGHKILGLSATAASSPLHLRALGYALGLHGLCNFYQWAARHGVRRIPGAGLKWMLGEDRQRETMARIHASIIPSRGVRVRREDIPGFPSVDIQAALYDVSSASAIQRGYESMRSWLGELGERSANDRDPELVLTKRLRMREEIELLKVPLAVELAKSYEEQGFSVATFFNFDSALRAFAQRIGTDCVIDGSITGSQRDDRVAKFQANQRRQIALNAKVGGVALSLQDLTGDHPRGGLVMPGESAVEMKQIFGRLPRDGGKSNCFYRVMLAAGTLEEKIYKAFQNRCGNIDALNDADLKLFSEA